MLMHFYLVFALLQASNPEPALAYPADESLTGLAYVEQGLPSPDRAWGTEDYRTASAVLHQVAAENPTHLPRYGSPQSGRVFGRFVEPQNLSASRMESLPIASRLMLASDFVGGGQALLTVYLGPLAQGIVFDDELVELMGFVLRAATHASELAEAFGRSIPPNDPQRQVRLEGLATMQSGLGELTVGCIVSLRERDTYRLPARRRLASHLLEHIPSLMPYLTSLQQVEVHRHVEELASIESDESLRKVVSELATALMVDR